MTSVVRKKSLVLFVTLILITGFIVTLLSSYLTSITLLRKEIISRSLPLTCNSIYLEIQSETSRPIHIATSMANDAYIQDWILKGEKNPAGIINYLNKLVNEYSVSTGFIVSEKTQTYYQDKASANKENDSALSDEWYSRVRQMQGEYEINIDCDTSDPDSMIVFASHRIVDSRGKFIGVAGVTVATKSIAKIINSYQKLDQSILLANESGKIIYAKAEDPRLLKMLDDIEGMQDIERTKLKSTSQLKYSIDGKVVYLQSRFMPQLKCYLLVEQPDVNITRTLSNNLIINLLISAIVTALALLLILLVVNNYQRHSRELQAKILNQHHDLIINNNKLKLALLDVKTLSGLLPVCSNCKKIKDDDGYWQPMEKYIREHSDIDFSHGICPGCAADFYGDLFEGEDF